MAVRWWLVGFAEREQDVANAGILERRYAAVKTLGADQRPGLPAGA